MNYNKRFSISKKISYICENEYNYFLQKKYVVGVALGYKISRGFSTFKKSITVFVEKKLSLSNLSKNDIIPKFYKNILTDVVESGVFKVNSLTSKVRPVINGYSIGNILYPICGTCGCLVHDKYLYILSSKHILALSNTTKKESVILQPGISDGGTIEKDVIGHLDRFIPIKYIQSIHQPKNSIDCALCKVISRSFVSPNIAFIGIPKGTIKASLHEDVQKVGRSTELTFGKITNLCGTTIVTDQMKQKALFTNQIITTKMSNEGDSGALLLTHNNSALGLLMSGGNNHSIYNPIDEVLKALKVQLVIA